MRHLRKGRKLSRKRDQRRALLKSLAVSLILKGKIKTTEARAKELRPFIEKLVTRSKRTDLATIRYLSGLLPEKARKKIQELGQRYQNRKGGYTRIIKLGFRKTDNAPMALIEFVEEQ